MFYDKLENIPNQSLKDLETYLNKKRVEGTNYVRHDKAARDTGVSKDRVLTVFSTLVDKGVLQAGIRVNCPHCATSHGGVYMWQSNVPDESRICMCGHEFEMGNKSNWEVVYEIPGEPIDFFHSLKETLEAVAFRVDKAIEKTTPARTG